MLHTDILILYYRPILKFYTEISHSIRKFTLTLKFPTDTEIHAAFHLPGLCGGGVEVVACKRVNEVRAERDVDVGLALEADECVADLPGREFGMTG